MGFGICYLRWAGANKRKPQTTHREFRPHILWTLRWTSVVIFSLRKDDDDEDVIKCTLLTEKIISGHPTRAFILAHFLAVLWEEIGRLNTLPVISFHGHFVPWSFRSEYKYFRSEPVICLIESFFYATKERMNSLFLERNDCKQEGRLRQRSRK